MKIRFLSFSSVSILAYFFSFDFFKSWAPEGKPSIKMFGAIPFGQEPASLWSITAGRLSSEVPETGRYEMIHPVSPSPFLDYILFQVIVSFLNVCVFIAVRQLTCCKKMKDQGSFLSDGLALAVDISYSTGGHQHNLYSDRWR